MLLLVIMALTALTAAPSGPARVACDASYSLPCGRINSEWLAVKTVIYFTEGLGAGLPSANMFGSITQQQHNYASGFYPFVIDMHSAVCVAHGARADFVGKDLSYIFGQLNLAYSSSGALHQRFRAAANHPGGDWVQY
eukprot:SAG25_NODE_2507_length_1562_cov_2.284347_1_plen_137_part_10